MMPKLDVLYQGWFARSEAGMIVSAASSVVLVRAARTYIVDPGASSAAEDMLKALQESGLEPNDIDAVINTHWHSDHAGNNFLFKDAELFSHKDEGGTIEGDYQLENGVWLRETKGHTRGHMSVFLEAEENHVIAGDALPTLRNYENWVPPGINYDEKLSLVSLKLIVDFADIIIPGHDATFPVERSLKR